MTATTSFIDEGIDRVQSAWKSVEQEVQKAQKRIENQGQKLNKRAEKQFKRFQKDLRTYPGVQRAEALGEDIKSEIDERMDWIGSRVGSSLQSVLGGLQIASQGEIDKIDRKLNRISRRLKALDVAINEKDAPARTK